MTPLLRRIGAGISRWSRVDPRLLICGAVLLTIATGIWLAYALAALPVYAPPEIPWWAFALAFFAAARLAEMDSPRRGTQAITLAAAPFVVGLFHATPTDLLIGYALGTSLAAATRRPVAIWQTAFDVIRFAVFAAIGIWAFRAIAGTPDLPVWHSAVAAIAATAITVLRRGLSEGVILRPRDRGHLDRRRQPSSRRLRRRRRVDVHRADRGSSDSRRSPRARTADGGHPRGSHHPPRLGARAVRP